ncbi:MAG: heavy metal sensor histidine kinase [Deltaproteobacteria bacterium]|jgi:two-component system heavy metal sensor histidine kinase CusS|nr:heavy metal sensor histidine kinase [Deltaproteobacteria bacterium]
MIQRWTESLVVRLTLLFSITALVVLCILGMAIINSIDQHFIHQDNEILEHQLENVRKEIISLRLNQEPSTQLTEIINRHEVAAIVYNPDGVWIARAGAILPNIDVLNSAINFPLQWANSSGIYRGLRGSFQSNHPGLPDGNIIVAMEISSHEVFLNSFQQILWIIIGIAIFFMGIIGWAAARIVLLPLRHLITGATGVSADKLNLRLPVESMPLELKELAKALNDMLERLDTSFTRLTDLSSDLAHELRTPLSNMKTQTQVALSQSRTAEEYRDILHSNVEELDRLSNMVNGMLFLAKAENGLKIPHPELIDLEAELRNLFDFYEVLADERNIKLKLEGRGTLVGDKLMLRRALSNLLTNAIVYSFPSSNVSVILEQINTKISIIISSHGETIAQEHLPRLFDRFYRIDSARQRSNEGVGLGLAITRSIIKIHGGTITAHSEEGTTRFIVMLPNTKR